MSEVLHETVLKALRLHEEADQPAFNLPDSGRLLVVGSGNAVPTGRFLFSDRDAVYADEGDYQAAMQRARDLRSAVVISASGTRHAKTIVADLIEQGLDTWLLTTSPGSPAAEVVRRQGGGDERIVVTASRPEPQTYNTSTYLGMLFPRYTEPSPGAIATHLERQLAGITGFRFEDWSAYYLLVEPEYEPACGMFVTKFDELFGPKVVGRSYTTETTKHAKNVVMDPRELWIAIGCENDWFGHPDARLHVPLPDPAGPAAAIAVGYYVIGYIQQRLRPYFWEHLAGYEDRRRKYF